MPRDAQCDAADMKCKCKDVCGVVRDDGDGRGTSVAVTQTMASEIQTPRHIAISDAPPRRPSIFASMTSSLLLIPPDRPTDPTLPHSR